MGPRRASAAFLECGSLCPELVFKAVADLLRRVEALGELPEELVTAYVAMIPKASGGTLPQDQRPISVLDVI